MKKQVIVGLLIILFATCYGQSLEFKNYSVPLQRVLDSMDINKRSIEIHIDKSDYKLSIVAGSKVLKEYPVVFGANPVDDKLRQGDKCTPEGTFKVKTKYPHSQWSKFIWFDYPNSDSWKKHNEAKQKGLIPASASIGGEVGIHGVPNNSDYAIDYKMNWTLGCISLKNKDINEIYEFVDTNTIVYIQK